MKRLAAAVAFLALFVLVSAARAEDKANPTGTWKWTVDFGGQTREQTLKLKMEGDKLTGSMLGRDNQETPIENAKFNKETGDISFTVTRERNGEKFTMKYAGKLSGDMFKGKSTVNFGGEERSFDFDAKRAAK